MPKDTDEVLASKERITSLPDEEVARLFDTCDTLARRDGARDERYTELEEAYAGYYQTRKTQGVWERTFARILPWYSDNNKLRPVVSINFARQIVGARRAQMGVQPQVRVPMRDFKGDMANAERREQVISYGWKQNYIAQRFSDAAWFASLYGTALTQIELDPKIYARYLVRSPKGCYAVPLDDDGLEFAEVYFINEISARYAAARYPNMGFEGLGDVSTKIVEVYNKDHHVFLCKDTPVKVLGGHTNPLDHVPIHAVRNIGIPGSWTGDSDLDDIIELQREYSRRFVLETEMVLRTLYAPLVIVNPTQVPKRIPYGPGAHITVHQGGDVKPVQMASLSYNWREGYDRIERLINNMSDTLPQQFGEMDSAIVTGKGFQTSMGPNINRVELRNMTQFPAWEAATRDWQEILERVYPNEDIYIFGNRKNSPYAFNFKPSEFGGDYDCEVYQDAASFFDQNTRWILGMQAVGQGLLSKKRFMSYFPWTDNAEAELDQIHKERMQDLQDSLAAQMQAEMFSAPDIGQTTYDQAQLEAGYETEPTAQSPVGGAPPGFTEMLSQLGPGAPTEPGEMSMGSEVDRVADAIEDCPNIRGRIWLVGSFVESGEIGPAGIEVVLSDMSDRATLQNYLRTEPAVSDLYGEYVFTKLPDGMDEPSDPNAIEVTPGDAGLESEFPEGDLDMMMEGGGLGEAGTAGVGLPPEMAP